MEISSWWPPPHGTCRGSLSDILANQDIIASPWRNVLYVYVSVCSGFSKIIVITSSSIIINVVSIIEILCQSRLQLDTSSHPNTQTKTLEKIFWLSAKKASSHRSSLNTTHQRQVKEEMADEIRQAKLNAARIEEEAAANTRSEMRDLTAGWPTIPNG